MNYINFRMGIRSKLLTEALQKRLEKDRKNEPSLTMQELIKRLLWRGLKK